MSYKWVTRDQRSDATEYCINLEDFFMAEVVKFGSEFWFYGSTNLC